MRICLDQRRNRIASSPLRQTERCFDAKDNVWIDVELEKLPDDADAALFDSDSEICVAAAGIAQSEEIEHLD